MPCATAGLHEINIEMGGGAKEKKNQPKKAELFLRYRQNMLIFIVQVVFDECIDFNYAAERESQGSRGRDESFKIALKEGTAKEGQPF